MDQVFDVIQMLIAGKIDPTKLIEDAEKAYQDLQNLGNCSNIEDFVDAAAQEFVERVKVNNATACVADVDGLYADVMAVVDDIKNGNESKLLLDLTKLASAATQTKTDCTPSKIVFGAHPKWLFIANSPIKKIFVACCAENIRSFWTWC